jgi:tripartite-type tricarboxylate transporter receptor subunit TctC
MQIARRCATLATIARAGTMLTSILACATASDAAEFPSRPIELIVPFAPGGPSDTSARVISDALRNVLRQPLIVVNKPGAGAIVATQTLLGAPADGHTLMMASNNLATSK